MEDDGIWVVKSVVPFEPTVVIGYFRTKEEAVTAWERITALYHEDSAETFTYDFEEFDDLDVWTEFNAQIVEESFGE
jgi:hypothetical protein